MQNPGGKVAFITGGAGGIGLALCRRFLAADMKVVLADIRRERLQSLEGAFDSASVHLIGLDVTDRRAMEDAAARTEEVFGGVDVLCNNAGVNLFGAVDGASYADWDWVLDVNLKGVVNGLVAFLPRIKARGPGGHILNTASIAGLIGSSKAGIYASSKAAVCALTESLWHDLAPLGIGVSVLCPGLVRSEIYRSAELHPEGAVVQSERLKEIHDKGMEPSEVAEIAFSAMQRNELFIFTHPEHKDEFLHRFSDIAGAFPSGPGEPHRVAFEAARREREAQSRQRGEDGLRAL